MLLVVVLKLKNKNRMMQSLYHFVCFLMQKEQPWLLKSLLSVLQFIPDHCVNNLESAFREDLINKMITEWFEVMRVDLDKNNEQQHIL